MSCVLGASATMLTAADRLRVQRLARLGLLVHQFGPLVEVTACRPMRVRHAARPRRTHHPRVAALAA